MIKTAFNYEPFLLVLLCFFGTLCILLFHEGIYIPVTLSSLAFVVAAISVVKMYRDSRIGSLTVLLFVVYALPFVHIFPYLWFDFEKDNPVSMWGFVANPYMTEKATIELMSMLGAVGATGFVIGALLIPERPSKEPRVQVFSRYQTSGMTLSIPVFMAWIAGAFLLSWISAPTDTVFDRAYTQSAAINVGWNFSSAWMISYACLVFAFADSMFESSARIRGLKKKLVLGAIFVIVVWFQLLRGDRESLPFVLAILLMYFAWGKPLRALTQGRMKINWSIVAPLAAVVVVSSFFVGALRHSLVGVGDISEVLYVVRDLYEAEIIRPQDLLSGTWSAALLTPLSVAGDYLGGLLPLHYGRTYLDMLASIVPGFLADWIGYTRPIDALRGPAWDMTYGLGGTHAVVVPFIDFRMAGVLLIVALWTFAIGQLERLSLRRLTVGHLSLLGIIALAIPHWLWYGEKYIINALIIWAILSIAYRLRLHMGGRTPRRDEVGVK